MPYFRKITRIDESDAPSSKSEYQAMENIGYKEDQCHSMFRVLPSQIKTASMLIGKYTVSMLNSNGGILAFGVLKTGVIYGEKISRWEKDTIRHVIDISIRKICPCVNYDQYLVKFSPVDWRNFMDDSQHKWYVLEIKVTAGDPYELYKDRNHEAFLRDGSSIVGPLTPHQIKRITVEKLKKKMLFEKHLADFFGPLDLTDWFHKALTQEIVYQANSLHGLGHMVVATRAISVSSEVGNKKSKKRCTSRKSSLATVVKKAAEKTVGVSKEVVESTNYSTNETGNLKSINSKDLIEKANNSKDDVLETWSSKDLVEVADSIETISSILEVKKSKGASVSSGGDIESSLPTEPEAQKEDEKENVSSNLTKRVASTRMLDTMRKTQLISRKLLDSHTCTPLLW